MTEQVAAAGLVHHAAGGSDAVVAAGSRAAADGWTVRYEPVVVVDGAAAEHLMSRQAAAVRTALEYLARYPTAGRRRPDTADAASAGPHRDDFLDLKPTAYRLLSAGSGCSAGPCRRTTVPTTADP